MFGFGKKNKVIEPEVQVKSGCTSTHLDYLMSSYGIGIFGSYLDPITAYRFFDKIGPLQSTVSKITGAIGDLPLILKNEDNPNEFESEHEALEILRNPCELTTKKEFLKDCSTSLMLTRELYVIARGLPNKAPLELVFIHPYNVQIIGDANSQWPISIFTNLNGERRTYNRVEDNGRFRYFDKSGLNEIYPFISERRSSNDSSMFRGVSPLVSIKDELLSYSSSVTANTAGIENSGKPSGVISPEDDDLSREQFDELSRAIENHAAGAINNGKILLLPANVKAAFQAWAPKDMDYETLQKNVKSNIWNLYSMPFPIVSDAGQTYSNFSEAQVAFYDEAVNEAFSVLADAYKWILKTRYDLEGWEFGYNPFEVPALKRRAIQNMKDMENSPLTENEKRATAGFEPNQDGDVVLVNSNKAPLSSVVDSAGFDNA